MVEKPDKPTHVTHLRTNVNAGRPNTHTTRNMAHSSTHSQLLTQTNTHTHKHTNTRTGPVLKDTFDSSWRHSGQPATAALHSRARVDAQKKTTLATHPQGKPLLSLPFPSHPLVCLLNYDDSNTCVHDEGLKVPAQLQTREPAILVDAASTSPAESHRSTPYRLVSSRRRATSGGGDAALPVHYCDCTVVHVDMLLSL